MTSRILLKGGRLIDPASKRDELLDLLIDDGRIAAVGRDLGVENAETIPAEGCWVCPGFIDLHVHLREPGQEEKETIATGAAAAVNGGFTAVCCMPNTDPPLDDAGSIRYVLERARAAGLARVYPIGAITRGLEGRSLTNMVSLAEEGAVALSDDGRMVMDALIMRRAMEYARGIPLPLTLHSIDENLARGGQMNEGRVAAFLGLAGIPSHAEMIAVARDIALAELTRARVHIAHVSTAGAVELIRAARARGLAVSGEVTPHHLALTDEEVVGYDTRFKMSPPLRTEEDRDALRAALADRTIDCIATDHAPHTEIEKDYPFDEAPFGVTGLETAVPVTYTVLVESGILTPMRWVETLSLAPARAFNLPGGTLEVGAPADITVLDPKAERVVRAETMKSRAKNSCFLGGKYRCWPVMTFVGGRRSAAPAATDF
jgi:dihydroorotase